MFDVAILGAGPAGSAAALELRGAGVGRVLLAEASRFAEPRIGESIPPDTRKLLDRMGVLARFLEEGHEPCLGSCSSWGADRLGYNDFAVNLYGSGWHLDRTRFDAFLAHQAVERGASLELGWRFVAGERRRRGGYRLGFQADDGRRHEVEAEVVVDATGRKARFARRRGARRQVHDGLVAVAGLFRLDEEAGLGRLTMLEACRYGWWYAARLPDRRAIVAAPTDPRLYKRLGLSAPATWRRRLAETLHLGPIFERGRLEAGSLATYPAPSFRLGEVCGGDWLAVGDAASCYDPIASQGIYKALATGISAAGAIARRLAGEVEDFSAYRASVRRGFADFLTLRDYLYRQEQRWADEPFWRRRLAAGARAG